MARVARMVHETFKWIHVVIVESNQGVGLFCERCSDRKIFTYNAKGPTIQDRYRINREFIEVHSQCKPLG